MKIPTIKPRISRISRDKENWFSYVNGSIDHEVIIEYVGAIMDLQILLMVIDRRGVSIMSAYSRTVG